MKTIRVGAACLNQTPLDFEGNLRRIREALSRARDEGVSILCFPELCLTGYSCEDVFHAPALLTRAEENLIELLPETKGMVVAFGLPLLHRNSVFNAAALVVDGELQGFVGKQFLAGDGIHYEPRWFKPWPRKARTKVRFANETYPFGDLYFEVGGVRIGFEICEDAWVAERPGADLSLDGVDIILNPSASHFSFEKLETRKRFVLEGSRSFGVSYVYANQVGNEAGRAIYDGGAVIASCGKLVAQGPRFGFQDVYLTHAVIDVELSRMTTARTGSFRPDVLEDDAKAVRCEFEFPKLSFQIPTASIAPWEKSPHLKHEEFVRAEGIALFDYLRKSRSRGFIVSLSGGADSTACAVLIAMMVRRAVEELGIEGFKARLGNLPGLKEVETVEGLVHELLTCVYQSTRNSGDTTRSAARGVAEALGAKFLEFDVDPLVQGYRDLVSQGLDLDLNWEQHDVALQNIQARVRSPSAWMLANLSGSLLVSTSNRSEAAVGYATMDGDTSGGLSPIAGVDKAYLRRWLSWMETEASPEYPPIPALNLVTRQAPTAELRPSSYEQTDEGDLMPYEVLDEIEKEAIRDKRFPLQVFEILRARHPDQAASQIRAWVLRFYRLFCRNQWKRERYAPSFHLDDENLDPRSWCRFPILSGGFEFDLRALEAMDLEGSA